MPYKKSNKSIQDSAFKMRSGNSPLKETKDWFNVRGYLKGEQGLIPDWKGEKTTTTASNVSKSIQRGHKKIKDAIMLGNYRGRRIHQKDKKISEGKKSWWSR